VHVCEDLCVCMCVRICVCAFFMSGYACVCVCLCVRYYGFGNLKSFLASVNQPKILVDLGAQHSHFYSLKSCLTT
jgi:hypothetical protein